MKEFFKYRIVEAFIIFWQVLTAKHYLFFSAKRNEIGNNGAMQYNSLSLQGNPNKMSNAFWKATKEWIEKYPLNDK